MKIAIVGKGTSAIITALVAIKEGHAIEIFHDPDQKHLQVGESTTVPIGQLIFDVTGLSIFELEQLGIVSTKFGVKMMGWGTGNTFIHNIGIPSEKEHYIEANKIAFHFHTQKFNDFFNELLERKFDVKYHAEKVTKSEEVEGGIELNGKLFDFTIWCSGWTEEESWLYKEPFISTVDSAILYQKDHVEPNYTIHRTTKDGWQFELPFPQEGSSRCGYLYNSKYSDPTKDKIFYYKSEREDAAPHTHINWQPRLSRKLIVDQRTAYNGNRLMFIEPIEALSLHYYWFFALYIMKYLKDPTFETYMNTNINYMHEMYLYQIMLAFHYSYGATQKGSQYWEVTTAQAQSIMNSREHGDHDFLEACIANDMLHGTNFSGIGLYRTKDMLQLHSGFTGKAEEEILNTFN